MLIPSFIIFVVLIIVPFANPLLLIVTLVKIAKEMFADFAQRRVITGASALNLPNRDSKLFTQTCCKTCAFLFSLNWCFPRIFVPDLPRTVLPKTRLKRTLVVSKIVQLYFLFSSFPTVTNKSHTQGFRRRCVWIASAGPHGF